MHRVAAVFLLLLLAALGAPPVAPQSPATPAAACGARDLDGLGLACFEDGLFTLFSDEGRVVARTHGGDPMPAPAPNATAMAAFDGVAPRDVFCVESPAPTAYYNQLLYVHAANTADRSATVAASLRSTVKIANGVLFEEGAPFGIGYDYRFNCIAGVINIVSVSLPTLKAEASPSSIFADLQDAGFNNPRIKYWAWYDDQNACGCGGIGHVWTDDSLAASNDNNGNEITIAITFGYTGGDGARIMMHENGHNMGAVQRSAPHSSGSIAASTAFHCNDGLDVMCYRDGGSRQCPVSDGGDCENTCYDGLHYDCGHDDYFHPSPAPGSYLATHWNIASSLNRFLQQGIIDVDGDGARDDLDNCPATVNADQADLDADNVGDACDADDDGDGDADGADNCPRISNADQADANSNAVGDACEDQDADGVADVVDLCPAVADPAQLDSDGDALGNLCDPDDDNDGVADGSDNCPFAPNALQDDTNDDDFGDACQPVQAIRGFDRDGDGMPDRKTDLLPADNCGSVFNAGQANLDVDRLGDACDSDDDGDGIADTRDNCTAYGSKTPFNPGQADSDNDGVGDACDDDDDGDGDLDGADNCPVIANADQADANADARGDACESSAPVRNVDSDGDGVPDKRLNGAGRSVAFDNCPKVANPTQANLDGDRMGDACDTDDDNDRILDTKDPAPLSHALLTYVRSGP